MDVFSSPTIALDMVKTRYSGVQSVQTRHMVETFYALHP